MFQPLSELFTSGRLAQDDDLRHELQFFLQGKIRSEGIVCDRLLKGVAEVRVSTPDLRQEVALVTRDCVRWMQDTHQYRLTDIRVRVG